MSDTQPACPACSSTHIVKNGKIHNSKQNFKCRDCGRQFVQDWQNKVIDEATKTLIDKLLLEKIQPFPNKSKYRLKKGALDDSMRRDVVVCG